jgi:hypothetical protein
MKTKLILAEYTKDLADLKKSISGVQSWVQGTKKLFGLNATRRPKKLIKKTDSGIIGATDVKVTNIKEHP